MSVDNEKSLKIDSLISLIEKEHGKGTVQFGERKIERIPVISSTGSLKLDTAIGVGGLPRGKIVEIYGPESGGKTTLTIHLIRECQKAGGVAAFVDAEHALYPSWVTKIGANYKNILFSQPDSGEEALDIVETMVDSGVVDLIIVDSVAALVPKAEIEGDMGDSHMGLQARLMSQACRKLTAKISKSKCTVVFINQLRMKIGVMFGSPETTTGGNALKFYASIRLDVRQSEVTKDKDGEVGQTSKVIKVKVVKNKVAPPFKIAEITLNTNEDLKLYGFSREAEILDLAAKYNIVKKLGTWYSYNDDKIGQGYDNSVRFLKENPTVSSEIYSKLEPLLFNSEDTSFESELDKAMEENAEGKTRKRRTKETAGEAPVELDESKISEGEVVASE